MKSWTPNSVWLWTAVPGRATRPTVALMPTRPATLRNESSTTRSRRGDRTSRDASGRDPRRRCPDSAAQRLQRRHDRVHRAPRLDAAALRRSAPGQPPSGSSVRSRGWHRDPRCHRRLHLPLHHRQAIRHPARRRLIAHRSAMCQQARRGLPRQAGGAGVAEADTGAGGSVGLPRLLQPGPTLDTVRPELPSWR